MSKKGDVKFLRKRTDKKYPISSKNKKSLNEFLNSLKAQGTDNPKTLEVYESSIRRALFELKKDLSRLSERDLDNYFSQIKEEGTRELIKMKFKSYLKFKGYKTLASHIKIKSKYFKKSRKTVDDVLTENEINTVLDSTINIRNKAMFELFITTGIRRQELVKLKLGNIEVLPGKIRVKGIIGKFGKERNVSIIPYSNNPVAFHPRNFESYYDNHPFKGNDNAPLFFSTDPRSKNQPFNPTSISQIVKKIGEDAGINRKITPHILRHTGASHDGWHLSTQALQEKYAWDDMKMAEHYCHINGEQLDGYLMQKAGLTPQIIERESKCPWCGHVNNINAIKCVNCKRVINKDEIAKQYKEIEEREKARDEQLDSLDKRLRMIEDSAEKYINPDNPETMKFVDKLSDEWSKGTGLEKDDIKQEINRLLVIAQNMDKKELIDKVERKDYYGLAKNIKEEK